MSVMDNYASLVRLGQDEQVMATLVQAISDITAIHSEVTMILGADHQALVRFDSLAQAPCTHVAHAQRALDEFLHAIKTFGENQGRST